MAGANKTKEPESNPHLQVVCKSPDQNVIRRRSYSGKSGGCSKRSEKPSGNGREWGELGFEEFLETKAVFIPKR